MSDQQPPRRRRIAGESKPGDQPKAAPRRVVRKPVARPGAPAKAEKQKSTAPSAKPRSEARKPQPDETMSRAGTKGAVATETARPSRPAPRREKPAREKPAREKPARPETTAARPESGGVTWSRPLVAIAVLAVAAVVFGVVGVVLGVDSWRGSRGIDSAQDAATETAASSVGEIFSYDYTDVNGHLEDAQKLMTPSFAKKFATISPALGELAPQRKIQVKAESREAAAVPCGDDCSQDAVTVLVFFDQARLADGSKTPTVFGNRVAVSMVKDGGDWLVDDIRAL